MSEEERIDAWVKSHPVSDFEIEEGGQGMDLLQDIGRRLCIMRNYKGYHVKKVARLVGVTESAIYRLEHGDYVPLYSVYEDVCRVLGTTFSEVMAAYRWTYTEPKQNESEVDFSVDYRKVS